MVSAGTLLTAIPAVTVVDAPPVAIANMCSLLGYMGSLILMSVGFTTAGRLIGIDIATVSFCFLILTFRPNFTGVEFF